MSSSASPRFIVQPHDPAAARRRLLLLLAVWLATLALAVLGGWLLSRVPVSGPDPVEFARLRSENEQLKQRVAVLERADQVDKVASSDLQQTLREREEEIAGLRTDLGFYARLVGGGARREGLAVHSVHVEPVKDSRAWNVVVTLTQNMKRSQSSEGRLQIAIEGVANGQLRNLSWNDLAAGDSAGLPFSFKYFQRVSGTVMLPAGFSPNRIKVVAEASGGGGRVEQGFAWSEAQAAEESSNVQQ
ncbi:MAG: hypothetical protein BGP24_12105 [Lysobacterales bacterium 69-70]|nr:hypothetical protein [Xanthomonadaceae bacterium]ODU30948.1 MAG: hypothetical protein ABS97_21865 [Xanthomonadaceae bacterium SCN 69-320]ODV15507.1 MAG: hypothetical protein ABT27_22835 [Xanthomonadaceae bacterium SCN 69-25]OJY98536.1 MAG: hypothetical protein BGP24_12105 [Xanthomonadales bacterium 69-70]